MNAGVTEKAVLYSRSRFSWELSEIRAAKPDGARLLREAPAAFGRLCVETVTEPYTPAGSDQPPSGGCVLKQNIQGTISRRIKPAAFGRLCVETSTISTAPVGRIPAAFGRLCVETIRRFFGLRA